MSPSAHAFLETYALPLQLVLAMIGMGATLRARDFANIARDPRGLALGVVLQLAFVPLLALTFIEFFDLSPGWAVGLLLVAVVPGGTVSNLYTFVGRGNAALSVTVTTVTTAAAVVTIPLILTTSSAGVDVIVPTDRIVRDIGVFLLLPLGLGMVLLARAPEAAPVVSRWSIRSSLGLVGVIVVSALSSGRIEVGAYGWAPPAIILGFGVALAAITPQICRLFGRHDEDTVALSVEVVLRNVGIALLLIRFFFPGRPEQAQVLYSCLFYGGSSFFLGVPIVLRHRLGRGAVLFRRPWPSRHGHVAPAPATAAAR